MPRIAIVTSVYPNYPKSYTSFYAGSLSHALTQQGHDVHIITSAIPEIEATFKKVTVHKIIKSWGILDLRRLGPLFQQIKPDILHVLHPTELARSPSQFFVQALIETNRVLWKLPTLTSLFNFNDLSWFEKLKLAPIIAQSNEITVPQNHIQTEITKLWNGANQKTHVINVGAKEEEIFKPSLQERAKWDVGINEKVICFLEELTEDSGFVDMVEASSPLLRKNKNLKIMVPAGWRESTFRHKMITKLERENILNQFIFTGQLNEGEMLGAKQASDLFVFLGNRPLSSNFSWKIQSALYSQAPTLSWNEEQNYNEFGIRHGQNIWLSPFKNIQALRADLELLITNSTLRETLAQNASVFRGIFNFDTISNEMSRIYSRLLRR
jgi:glycosyltransferase involved in cell wall biosynthesis